MVSMWKMYAREAMGATDYLDREKHNVTVIRFNDFFESKESRRHLAHRLRLEFNAFLESKEYR